ncbi:lymphocyte antigen 6 family member pge isoform X1 [Phycodurus eques]|uniref:lymphocyte antigen 6 family member pge isoform X1 n=1 Tax=Phycodurus eques TaxID=693459 RepID=UPI002ACDB57C|nr:lymphocyte antigen 6 family member pge isoform X1 [Phycodurus eques]XP_061546386.1 lymphocyte antigen 6 family member pge isoform X1 [Phycodurus eques]
MRALLILLYMVLLTSKGTALQCYTCMASNNEDCNRQGSRTCTSYSDACAVVVGHNSGVMKSCSYKSFCSQANSQSSRRPGVRVHCCYSNGCNITSAADRLHTLSSLLLFLTLFYHCFFR